ncbi:MAG: ribonucleoside-diphosphate reductase subunit alpha [Candidatus Magasanikbacteria bacterium]|nr:ribonucleoside-diphosphate reductase subunit alpha [Candidatus Magasanikbacteria bacterium]
MTPPIRITRIKKRNGEIVSFDSEKIAVAIEKAFGSTRGGVDAAVLQDIATTVLATLDNFFADKVPGVEDVQNVVESALMNAGYFDVAKHYIIYRYEHTKQRAVKKEEVAKKMEQGGLFVIKRNGQKELFSMEKLKNSIRYYVQGYQDVIDVDVIANQCRQEVYEDISTKDIARSLVMVFRSFIEHDPAYTYVTSRALLAGVYKEVIGPDTIDHARLEEQQRAAFKLSIHTAVGAGRLDPRMLMFNLDELASRMVFDRDNLHTYLSTQTIVDRYFLRIPETNQLLETPQMFWMRVAMGLCLGEKHNRDEWALKFYEEMSTLRYIPSTPTLFHSGTMHPQMSACYLTTVNDSLDHIFKCIGDNAQLSKWSGGIGNDWTYLRGTGALIKGTGVSSQGIIPFLKIANDTTGAINRSGRRRGATCAYLETWHWDIEDFLELRKNTGDERRRTHDMNTANWIPDLFMKRVREDGEWSLFSPEEVPDLHDLYGKQFDERYAEYERRGKNGELRLYRALKAKDLWKKMLTMLFETGHPWLTFKDACNVRSPQDHAGVVHSSNLCTEITLNTSFKETAVCNLGSLNMERFISGGKFDRELLRQSTTLAMRMLDNVVDLNFYPTAEAKDSNFLHRPVGLGVRGFQDALYMLGINFDSELCVQFADQSMELISYYAILGSSELAKERGAYPSYRGSKWDRNLFPVDTIALLEKERGMTIDVDRQGVLDWTPVRESVRLYGMRNSNCLAVAPSATTANISGCVPTIEPIYKNIYVKANQAGDFTIVNPYLIAELKKRNLWDAEMLGKLKYHDGDISKIQEVPQELKDRFKEAFQIDPRWLIKAAAYRGKWIDQSQSLNIFYSGNSGKEINDIYMYAWEMGLKTTYYMRTLAISQVEKSTVQVSQFGATHTRESGAGAGVMAAAPVVVAAPAVATPSLVTPPEVAPMASFIAEPAEAPMGKACRIDDPECESCSG